MGDLSDPRKAPDAVDGSSIAPADRAGRPPFLHIAVAALLLAWAALGAVHTGVVMVRPEGWRAVRPPGTERAIGVLGPGAADVTAVAEVLDGIPGDPTAPVLVRYPAHLDDAHRLYLRYQLNHVAYPRPVDVVAGGRRPRLDASAYVAVIVAPGATASDPATPTVEHREFRVLLTREP